MDERDRAEHLVPAAQRDHDGGAEIELADDPEVLGVDRAGREQLGRQLPVDLRPPGPDHVRHARRCVRVRWVAATELAGDLDLRGVDVGDRDLADPAVGAVDDADADPVRQLRHRELRDRRKRGLVVRRRDELLGRTGEERAAQHLALLLAGVAEHEDHAVDRSIDAPDRCGAVVDLGHRTVAPPQHGVVREADDDTLAKHLVDGVLDDAAGLLVEDREHVVQRAALGVGGQPAGQALGDRVHERHAARRARRDHRVPDAAQRGRPQLQRALGLQLGFLARRDVERDAEPLADPAIAVEERDRARLHPDVHPVVTAQPVLRVERRAGLLRARPHRAEPLHVIGMDRLPSAAVAPVVLALAGELAPAGGVGVGVAIRVGGPHDRVRRLDERAVRAIGEVARDLREADRPAARIVQRRDHRVGPELRAVLAEPPADVLGAAGGQRAAQQRGGLAGRAILGREERREVLADDLAARVALEAPGTGVPRLDRSVEREQVDRVVLDGLHQQPERLWCELHERLPY